MLWDMPGASTRSSTSDSRPQILSQTVSYYLVSSCTHRNCDELVLIKINTVAGSNGEGLVEGHALCVDKGNIVHRIKVLETIGLSQNVVALHHNDRGERGNTLELDLHIVRWNQSTCEVSESG